MSRDIDAPRQSRASGFWGRARRALAYAGDALGAGYTGLDLGLRNRERRATFNENNNDLIATQNNRANRFDNQLGSGLLDRQIQGRSGRNYSANRNPSRSGQPQQTNEFVGPPAPSRNEFVGPPAPQGGGFLGPQPQPQQQPAQDWGSGGGNYRVLHRTQLGSARDNHGWGSSGTGQDFSQLNEFLEMMARGRGEMEK